MKKFLPTNSQFGPEKPVCKKKKIVYYSKIKAFIPFKHIHCNATPFSVAGIGLQTPPLAHITF